MKFSKLLALTTTCFTLLACGNKGSNIPDPDTPDIPTPDPSSEKTYTEMKTWIAEHCTHTGAITPSEAKVKWELALLPDDIYQNIENMLKGITGLDNPGKSGFGNISNEGIQAISYLNLNYFTSMLPGEEEAKAIGSKFFIADTIIINVENASEEGSKMAVYMTYDLEGKPLILKDTFASLTELEKNGYIKESFTY